MNYCEVVRWTDDWRNHQGLTGLDLISAVTSRWKQFQIRDAREIVEFALTIENDATASLHHVWAGLDALHQGLFQSAKQHAQKVAPKELVGWYPLAYSILVAGCELWPDEKTDFDVARTSIADFTVQRLVSDEFKKDRLTRWCIARIRTELAKAHGARGLYFRSWLQAMYLRWF